MFLLGRWIGGTTMILNQLLYHGSEIIYYGLESFTTVNHIQVIKDYLGLSIFPCIGVDSNSMK